ncbi:MAG: hypothetical protein RJA67_660 [Bacteroidota bacterium]|jgi:hypothetical protein
MKFSRWYIALIAFLLGVIATFMYLTETFK